MQWEEGLGPLPKNIKKRIEQFRKSHSDSDWNEDNFLKTCDAWRQEVRDFTKEQINKNAHLKRAIEYAAVHERDLMPHWNEFISGTKDPYQR
jgi:hypothetical protein